MIVAVGVSNQARYVEYQMPTLYRIGKTAGALPDVMTAHPGYWSEDNAKTCAEQAIDAYISTGRPPRPAPTPETRTDAQGCRCESSDGPQAQK